MESVNTFIRYQSVTGRDPFDDFRMLEYYSKLFVAGVDGMPYVELLAEMASALNFAAGNLSIGKYVPKDDESMADAIHSVMKAFTSVTADDKKDKKDKQDDDEDSEYLSNIIKKSQDLDIKNKLDRAVMRFNASRKKNAVSQLLSNAIQVGMTIESILPMDYEQAVKLVNFRAKVLEEQQQKSKKR